MRKILKKKFWSHGTPLGYLGSLSRVHIMEFFQNLIGLVLYGLEVTPILVSAMVDFVLWKPASTLMCSPQQTCRQLWFHLINQIAKIAKIDISKCITSKNTTLK